MSRFKKIIFVIIRRAYEIPALPRADSLVGLNTLDTVRVGVWIAELGFSLSVFLGLAMLPHTDCPLT